MAQTTPRIASVVDCSLPIAQQKPVSTTTALAKPVQITKEQLTDHDEHVRQLNAMNLALQQVSQSQRSHPEQAPITFKNVLCPGDGSKVILAHNFGRHANFFVTKWSGPTTTGGPSLVCDEDDLSGIVTSTGILALRSYVEGYATIRVYPGS